MRLSEEKCKNVSTSVVCVDMSPRLANSFLGRKQGENTEYL